MKIKVKNVKAKFSNVFTEDILSPTIFLNIQELIHYQEQHHDNSRMKSVTSNDFVQTQNWITCENEAVSAKAGTSRILSAQNLD